MSFFKYLIVILTLFCLTLSCGVTENNQFKAKPKALGKMNQIVVVLDKDLWDGSIGDSLNYYFGGFYPLTPKPEPLFDLRFMSVEDLQDEPLKKQLRTYLILANLSDETSEATKLVKKDLGQNGVNKALSDPSFRSSVGKNKWANGQLLIYLFANSTDELANIVVENFEGVSARVGNHDEKQLYQSSFPRGDNQGISRLVSERFGANIKIPLEYKTITDAKEVNNTIWLRRDTKTGYMNLVLHDYAYESEEQLTKEASKVRLNNFGKLYVSSPEPNTYMVINDVDLPILEYDRQIDGQYTKEFRGIWEMENDFMGGPFMSYVVVNSTNGRILQIDGFILDPGKRKRDMMQQIDLIVKSITFN